MDARDLRRALASVAHVLDSVADAPRDGRDLTSLQHVELALQAADKAIMNPHGGDHLAEAAARILIALQRREFDRQRGERAVSPSVEGSTRLLARYGAG